MTRNLLPTKLNRPVPPTTHVVRLRLQQQLDLGLRRSLILISAAAGYGKTSLLSNWLTSRPEPVAWLSLDTADNDPIRFLSYLCAAIDIAIPDTAKTLPQALQSVPPPQPEQAFESLLLHLSELNTPLCILLDDYHLIENSIIHGGIDALIKQAGPNLTWIILCRADPPFPLGRLRANQGLLELRSQDLRFNETELAAVLKQLNHQSLSAKGMRQILLRTEGWPAGTQLAALALKQSTTPEQFINQFAGTNRFILDYLLEEVLAHLPEARLQFLYHVAHLPRFNATLANAVRQKQDSAEHLRAIEQQNLFLVPLDDKREWFRFHHLFADLLKREVEQCAPALIRPVHERASAWFETHDQPEAALDHALLADDYQTAGRLIAGPALAASYRSEVETLLRWYRAFPDGFANDNPRLALHFGVNFALNGRTKEAQALYAQMRDDDRLPAGDQLLWSYLMATTATDFPRLQDLINKATASEVTNPITATAIGLAYGLLNQRQQGCQWFEKAITLAGQIGQMEMWATAKTHLARFRLQMGEFEAATALSQEILALAPTHPLANALRSIIGRITLEQMHLGEAERYFNEAQALAWKSGLLAGTIPITNMFLAEIAAFRGNRALALQKMVDALAASERYDFPGELAWMKLHENRLHLTLDIPLEQPPQWEDIPQSRYHSPHFGRIQAAWYWLKGNRPERALPLLTHITSQPTNESTLDALCLLALTRSAQADQQNATTTLVQALNLAQQSGRKIPFFRLGATMRQLLEQLTPEHPFTKILLSQFPVRDQSATHITLTGREKEILAQIIAGRTNQEIANELTIAPSTVKWYVNSLYRKLNVKNRQDAITKTKTLNLLAPSLRSGQAPADSR